MPIKLNRAQLIDRIEHLKSGRWSEDEAEAILREIGENVPCPSADVQGYIFHSVDDPDAETIVERMLAHAFIQI